MKFNELNKKYFKNDESLGLYNFIGALVVVVYDKAVEQHNDKILSKFLMAE